MKKRAILAAGVLVLGMASAQTVIKIATASPLSGAQAASGELIKNGTQIAVEAATARFKALGFDLQLFPTDDQANPDTGVANANRIINDASILGIVGHLNSGVAIPSSEVYARVGVAMISPANTNPKVTDRKLAVTNRVCGRDDVQGPAGADFAIKTLKSKRIFVINDKTAYGQGLTDFFKKRAVELGAQVVGDVGTEEKANFAAIINQIRLARPDTVYVGATYDMAGPFARQLRAGGLRLPIVGGDGLDSGEYVRLAGEGAVNTYYTAVGGPVSAFPRARSFVTQYKTKFGKDSEGTAVLAFDAANIILNAIEAAIKANGGKLPERAAVAAEIRKQKLSGISGDIEFDSKGDPKVGTYYVLGVGIAGAAPAYPGRLFATLKIPAPAAP